MTPGIVEGGELEEEINEKLGELLAKSEIDFIMLIGENRAQSIIKGYVLAGGNEEKLGVYCSLESVKPVLQTKLGRGDTVLFLNDLPDVY